MKSWLVTIEKIATGAQKQRLLQAPTSDEAGLRVCNLIGGPAAHSYRVVGCREITT